MTACAAWIAADFLARHGEPYPDPPCLHSPDRCPPLTKEPR